MQDVIRRVVLLFCLVMCAGGRYALAQVDLSGDWRPLVHEDLGHRADARVAGGPGAGDGAGGAEIGDYTGLPINPAARLKADSWDPRIYAAGEHQAIVQPGAYWVHGPGGMRLSRIVAGAGDRMVGLRIYRAGIGGSSTRTIWMDGRPHPPAHAPHTWQGFSTGTWEGDALAVETTHLKAGWVRRNGVPTSDQVSMTERIVRHGDYLTIVRIVDDPIYFDEPLITSSTWLLDPRLQLVEPARVHVVEEVPGQLRAFVPHFLPGKNDQLSEFAVRVGLPFEATRGGRETQYPEYQHTLKAMLAETKAKTR